MKTSGEFTVFFRLSFSDMQDDLNAIQNNESRAKYCSQRLLCRTLAGNNVYILTITSPASQVLLMLMEKAFRVKYGTTVYHTHTVLGTSILYSVLKCLDRFEFLSTSKLNLQEELKRKHVVVLSARVHPGETPSSWIMRGILHFLTGESEVAAELRDRFIFKVISTFRKKK